ncbi:phosphoglycerate mutase family protein [Flavobacterium rivuli]|uniref:phosphoglycerate mutase family protein n=1 Tax=Flavobacterium rivuli TaxID=498301 RepID=UPI000371FC81|nr:phosphoglycerate mutase family protein [Flavobacterium rivuli]
MKNFYLTIALLLFFAVQGQEATTTIYLIRHAEKVDDSADHELSEAGNLRANKWADYFKEKQISIFYTTANKRSVYTIMTATVIALDRTPGTTYNTEINTYDPKNFFLKDIAEKHKGEKIIVVGHGNTIPATINNYLGKNIYKDIPENEYGNLYIITIKGDNITHELVKI